MKTRIISGAVLVVIGVAAIVLGGPVLLGVLLFCSLIGMDEYFRAAGVVSSGEKTPAAAWTAFAGACAYYAAVFFLGGGWCLPVLALVILAVMSCYVLTFSKISSAQAADACFGFVYVAVMLCFVYLIRAGEKGLSLVWLVFLSSWVADTCAYFTGYFLGKHKMAPVLSPKKTIEGAAGGILGSALSGVLFALIVGEGSLAPRLALICGAGAVISIFGDLAASAVKRDRGIKDYGNLIPGHGGILDRFDSVIFTAPVIYFLMLALL